MKKIFLLLMLIPLSVLAKFHQGSITFNDGSTKKGFIEVPVADDSKIKFKSEEKGKTEKFEIDQITGFEIVNDDKAILKYTTMKLATVGFFNHDKISIDKKKSWVRIEKKGKVSIYSAYFDNGQNGYGYSYYIQREKDDFCVGFTMGGSGGLDFVMNGFADLKRIIKALFEKECPKLVNLLDKDDLKKNGLGRIVELYEQNCGAQN